ncbi:TLC domain-containing protein 4-B-like [Styela clava]
MSWLGSENIIYIASTIWWIAFFQWIYHVGSKKFLMWTIPNEYGKLSTQKQNISRSGVSSAVNGIIMFVCSLYLLLNHNLHDDLCWKDDFYVRLLACVEMGCYLADTFVLLTGETVEDTAFYIFHHLCIVFGSYIVIVNKVFPFFICLRGLNEISVPFQHLRQTFYDIGWKNNTIYLVNGLAFLFTFFFGRICVIPITMYFISQIVGTAELASVSLFCKVVFLGGVVIIDALNIYWFSLISNGAYKILFKKKHV